MRSFSLRQMLLFCVGVMLLIGTLWISDLRGQPPVLNLPDSKISEVYRANWINTLQPCTENLQPANPENPHAEPKRPWKVDVNGHYPGWYPGVDVKHQAAAYLACGYDLARVLQAWHLITRHHMMSDGGIKPSTMYDNPQGIWPEATAEDTVVYYPLKLVATIDYLLLGDLIFRYSQDRQWLNENLPAMRKARDYLAGWMDQEGLLLSYSYDLDQVYREIDGVAQAAVCLAFNKLADLERIAGGPCDVQRAASLAAQIKLGCSRHLWDADRGFFTEHLCIITSLAMIDSVQ